MGGLIPATDYRIKTAILHVGGLMMQKTLPEVDVFNYLPRVNIPVLMLNGRNDQFYPIETSQKPMFDFLGSPKNEKELLIYPGGHFAPRTELIKETLRWMDQYLGPVQKIEDSLQLCLPTLSGILPLWERTKIELFKSSEKTVISNSL
jgi:hypothetical protein